MDETATATWPTIAGQDDPRPLRDQVRDSLRTGILSGQLPAGTRLKERDLAAALGVSRLPVREAIRMLESEHLVSVQAHRGVIVRSLDLKDIEDLFDIREALEVLEARLATQRTDRRGLRMLERHLEDATHALRDGDRIAMNEANTAFHGQVAALADNSSLSAILEPVSERLRWIYGLNMEPERVIAEHRLILEAIAAGDPEATAAVALRHVREARRMVIEMMRADQSTTDAASAG